MKPVIRNEKAQKNGKKFNVTLDIFKAEHPSQQNFTTVNTHKAVSKLPKAQIQSITRSLRT